MTIYEVFLFGFLFGTITTAIVISFFFKYMKQKHWIRFTLTTKFHNDFNLEKCQPKKKINLT